MADRWRLFTGERAGGYARLIAVSHKLDDLAVATGRAHHWYNEPNWSSLIADTRLVSAARYHKTLDGNEHELYIEIRWRDALRSADGTLKRRKLRRDSKLKAAFGAAILAGDQVTAYELVQEH